VRGDGDILGAEHLMIIHQFALFFFREFGVLKISAGEPWFDQADLDVFFPTVPREVRPRRP